MALSVIGLFSLGLYMIVGELLWFIVGERDLTKGTGVVTRKRRQLQTIAQCCKRILIATFRKERLVGIEHLHTGPLCVGSVDTEEVAAWRTRHGLR